MRLHYSLIPIYFILQVFSPNLHAKSIVVEKSGSYPTIKEALREAKDGDTIYVRKGLYKEGNLLIDKSITLLGENYPVLDGDKKYEVVSVKSHHVIISGFKIQHSSYATLDDPGGVKIYNSNYVTIENNILYDNFFGVYIQYGKHCHVRNNKIVAIGKEEQSIGNGIHCWKSDSLLIIGNHVTGHRDGIYFEFVTHSVIWRNISVSNIRYGLHFMFSNDDAYIGNVFRLNGAGVAVMFTKKVIMINNTFSENWGDAAYGLLLKEINDSHIEGNLFKKNTSGIFMEGTNRIKVIKNKFHDNGWAMKIQASCMDNDIITNNFISNTFDIATNGNLVLNTFQKNYWDKYTGYDLDKDNTGDVPYRPLSMYSVLAERIPASMLLYQSFMITLLDKSEKIFPTLTPDNFIDLSPSMTPLLI